MPALCIYLFKVSHFLTFQKRFYWLPTNHYFAIDKFLIILRFSKEGGRQYTG